MSLVPCPECGHHVSTEERACPSCGIVLRKRRRVLPAVLTLAMIAIIVGWICLMIPPNEEQAQLRRPSSGELHSWDLYPWAMRITEAAAGYHYRCVNEIQKVADFKSGQRVKVLQKSYEWFYVQLSDDARRWVHQTHLK